MKVVYVAGPYSAPDSWQRELNVRRAEAVAMELVKSGAAPICVHTMARHWFGYISEEDAIEYDLELLCRCDALVLVEGWENSKGTRNEIRVAVSREMPIYQSVADFKNGLPMKIGQIADPSGTQCSVCGLPQYQTPSGLVCENGHGGA